ARRELADIAAGEPPRADDECICRHRDAMRGGGQRGLILERAEHRVVERRQEHLLEERVRQPAAGAVREHDVVVAADRQRAVEGGHSTSSSPSARWTASHSTWRSTVWTSWIRWIE